MKIAVILAFVLLFAQNPPKKPDRDNAQSQNKADSTREAPAPVTVNCNQSTGAVAGDNRKETPKRNTPIEWSNWALVGVAAVTGFFIWRQFVETRRSVIVSLRPKLLLRGIEILPLNPNAGADIIPSRHIQIGVSNAGGTEARITSSNLSFRRETDFSDGMHIVLPAFPPYDPNGATFASFTLRAGEHARRSVQLDDNMSFTLMLRDVGRQDSVAVRAEWFCFGFFDYQDSLGINRRTGFAFRYNVGENRFTRMDNTEYNYAD